MKTVLSVLALLLLTSCGGSSSIDIQTKPVETVTAQAADPAAVSMLPVRFRVVNRQNLDKLLAELRDSQGSDNPVFIAITTQDYENLVLNLADLTRYISQQKSVIVYYRNITQPSK